MKTSAFGIRRNHRRSVVHLTALLLATAQKDKKPVYKKAWFWVVIGGVVVAGAVGLGVGLALRPKDPSSDLGLRVVQF